MENDLRYGKVMESVRADLENYSVWVGWVMQKWDRSL